MGRYIRWDDVVDRYPEIDDLGGEQHVNDTWIAYAEGHVDGALDGYFTTPFSDNNVTVRDLAIDLTFWRAGRHKLDDAAEVGSASAEMIEALKNRSMRMVSTSGEVLSLETVSGVFSSTESYQPIFGVDDPIRWRVDSSQLSELEDDRDGF